MNAINSLLENPFLARDLNEQLKIKKLGRPTPLLNLSNTQNVKDKKKKTCKRKFNPEIYSQHDWIAGCESTDSLFCFPCVLFGGDSPWATTGYNNLIHLSNAITSHELDVGHIHNAINYSAIGKISKNEQKKTSELRNVEVDRNLQVLDLLIKTIKFCAQGYIPIIEKIHDPDNDDSQMMDKNAVQEVMELVCGFNTTLKSYLKLDIFKNEMESMKMDIVNIAFYVYVDEVLQEINKADFLSIIIEELNVQDEYSNVLILRYVVDGKPVERIWKLLEDQTDDILLETLTKELCLIINDPNKLISQSYQKLNFKSGGTTNSLHCKIQALYPNAHLVHFYRHDLHDIIVNTMDFHIQVRIFYCRVWSICDFFTKEPWAKITLKAFEDIVDGKSNRRQKWDFEEDRLNTVYNYKNELLETMTSIEDNALNYHGTIITKAYNFAQDLKDDEFAFWLESFHLIIPYIEQYFMKYESCLKHSDTEFSFMLRDNINRILENDNQLPVGIENPYEIQVKREEEIEIVYHPLEYVKMESESNTSEETPGQQPSTSTISVASKKRKLYGSNKELVVDAIDTIILQLQERLKFRGHTFASRLVETKHFQEYSSDFPESHLEVTVKCFPILNSITLRSELEVLYERSEYRTIDGACALLEDILESKLQSTLPQTVKLLNIVLTIPTKSSEPSRCFSTLSKTEFYLKNCRDPELSCFLLPLACEKEFIDNIFEFNKKVTQIFAERPNRSEHFKRQSLPTEN